MFDYRKWVERAKNRTKQLEALPGTIRTKIHVGPPSPREAIETISRKSRLSLPLAIVEFIAEGSAHCSCEYSWDPPKQMSRYLEDLFGSPSMTYFWGGAKLCLRDELLAYQEECLDLGSSYDVGSLDRDYWQQTVPFLSMESGDYLGLYLGATSSLNGPPVIYLNHDKCVTGALLAPDFHHFLTEWESLYYIGPDLMLSFVDESGAVVPEKRKLLAKLFDEAFNIR